MAQATGQTVSRAEVAYERQQEADRERQRDTYRAYGKLVFWLVVWGVMMCMCQAVANSVWPENPRGLQYLLEGLGTAAMLLVAFWRAVLYLIGITIGLAWTVVWLVIFAAIVKVAFHIVF